MKTRSMCKAERMSLDRISTLPEPVLETILRRLKTEEAARTSVLSKAWRYYWTTIPELRFNLGERTFELASGKEISLEYMYMHDVHQILLRHRGLIHNFTLHMNDYWEHYDYFEFYLIILHLSNRHIVKELYLDGLGDCDSDEKMWYELPDSVFSLHHLTDLYLCAFDIDYPSIFNGFGSLVSLSLIDVKISSETLLHILSKCPSLKTLSLHIDELDETCESRKKCTTSELFKCLPMIEDLTLSGDVYEWLVVDSVPRELPNLLIHLKSLCLNQMCLAESYGSALLLVLIKCSPNLKRMHLEMEYGLDFSAVKDDYSDVWLEHLDELSTWFCSNLLYPEFVEFILARSPNLRNVIIFTMVDRKQESSMVLTLKRAPRASPGVIIAPFKLRLRL